MIKQLMMKWFGLEPEECKTCQILRAELDYTRRQNEIYLDRLIVPREETRPAPEAIELKPLAPSGGRRFIPQAVRQQMMETEDKKTLELLIKSKKDIQTALLEKEVLGEAKEMEQEDAAKSAKQYRFMAGIAHGMKPKTGVGPSKEVAEEFVKKTPKEKRSMFAKKGKK